MSTIAIHTTLLADALIATDPALRDRQRRWAGAIDEARERLLGLVDRFAAAAREPTDAECATDLRDVATRAGALLAPLSTARRVACTAAVPDAPVRVLVSDELALQVVLDFALVAVDACAEGGQFTIAAVDATPPRLEVRTSPEPIGHGHAAAVLASWGSALDGYNHMRVRASRDDDRPALLVEFPTALME